MGGNPLKNEQTILPSSIRKLNGWRAQEYSKATRGENVESANAPAAAVWKKGTTYTSTKIWWHGTATIQWLWQPAAILKPI